MPRPDRQRRFPNGWTWLVLWGIAVALALALRPLLAIDETRYLSVAWEMWLRHDWLVPYLNGNPYPDKPPLLFWGMLLGWRLFGVNQWWPRLLQPIFAVISALLLVRLTRQLEPELPDAADRTLPFLSGLLWVTYSTLVLFDTLLTSCVLLALLGLVQVWRGGALRGWMAYGAGVGLGLLSKGPVVLIHVLPAAVLAPWWTRNASERRWGSWYFGLVAALALGAGLGLAWALTASADQGGAYRDAILWGQTAGRITKSFAHRHPVWWYLPAFPLVLLPWSLWPQWWRSLAGAVRAPANVTVRFGLAWVIPGFVILSLISGKQPHYLFPLLPGVALLAAKALPSDRRQTVDRAESGESAAGDTGGDCGEGISGPVRSSAGLELSPSGGGLRPTDRIQGAVCRYVSLPGTAGAPVCSAELGAGPPMGSGASHRSADSVHALAGRHRGRRLSPAVSRGSDQRLASYSAATPRFVTLSA